MGLYDLFLQAANAKAHSPVGIAPTFGDALQGIGHSMQQHYLGTPEKIATLAGTFPGHGAPRDDIGALIQNFASKPQAQPAAIQAPAPVQQQPMVASEPMPLARPGVTPLSMLGAIFGQGWGQQRK